MTTTRAVVLLLVAVGLVLFAVQNASPWLSLAIFGIQTQPLPLWFWLVGAIAAGAVTTLFMVGLLNLYGPEFRPKSPRVGRARAKSSRMGASPRYGQSTEAKSSGYSASGSPVGSAGSAPPSSDANEQDWSVFKSPGQWDDWEQRPDPSVAADAPVQDSTNQGKSKRESRRRKEQYAVEESFEEIAGGWDEYEEAGYEESDYVTRGGSPIDDALDDISAGWEEEIEDKPTPTPPKDYEVKQTPKTVYHSGSLYSYSYDKTEDFDADRVKDTHPREHIDDDDIEDEDYPADTDEATEPRQSAPGPGRVGPDGVYEADYRVIIPPYRNLDEADD